MAKNERLQRILEFAEASGVAGFVADQCYEALSEYHMEGLRTSLRTIKNNGGLMVRKEKSDQGRMVNRYWAWQFVSDGAAGSRRYPITAEQRVALGSFVG